jgi:hypothetical protein
MPTGREFETVGSMKMANLSQQGISDAASVAGQDAPARGFDKIVLSTKDAGRVILGGACGGVKANNMDKVRR